MFKVSELGQKDMINTKDGVKLGPVKDMHLDIETGNVKELIVRGRKKYFGLLGSEKDWVVSWEQIKKIGQDAVLVEV
ncbi:MAG: YlmC/YmxH family sporulation protein [Clostridiales bacterium]|nr:YlmC/YmxH family sporulation protein [Clostridiales bacterium]MCF8022907.1 YlmC/YmxH family sporulation protein [Clostridiales bacterium]